MEEEKVKQNERARENSWKAKTTNVAKIIYQIEFKVLVIRMLTGLGENR